jgi:hypothetical protein
MWGRDMYFQVLMKISLIKVFFLAQPLYLQVSNVSNLMTYIKEYWSWDNAPFAPIICVNWNSNYQPHCVRFPISGIWIFGLSWFFLHCFRHLETPKHVVLKLMKFNLFGVDPFEGSLNLLLNKLCFPILSIYIGHRI